MEEKNKKVVKEKRLRKWGRGENEREETLKIPHEKNERRSALQVSQILKIS